MEAKLKRIATTKPKGEGKQIEMSEYTVVDAQIRAWAQAHELMLSTHWAGGEARNVYVSSAAGECFQIWVDYPVDGEVCIHAAGVESRNDAEPPQDWRVPVTEIHTGLEAAWATVIGWMIPSERYYPPTRSTPSSVARFWRWARER